MDDVEIIRMARQAERYENRVKGMLATAKKYAVGTYTRQVAKVFQEMIRAEYGCKPAGYSIAVKDGQIAEVWREVGQVVCVTCGYVAPWKGTGSMQTGHAVGGRCNSILFEEMNVASQCTHCNHYESGKPEAYRLWMDTVRPGEYERLTALKREVRKFDHEWLVRFKIECLDRTKKAQRTMNPPGFPDPKNAADLTVAADRWEELGEGGKAKYLQDEAERRTK